MILAYRPIVAWPHPTLTPVDARVRAPFSASWDDTLEVLEREVGALAPEGRNAHVTIRLAYPDRVFRADGALRADAGMPEHPGAIVAFASTHGPITMATDQFHGSSWTGQSADGWRSNVRAIALALEALRKVDRYGVSRRGEQYAGWGELPSGRPMGTGTETMTVTEAAGILHGAVDLGGAGQPSELIGDRGLIDATYRVAARRHHPDHGGDPDTFRRITAARELLVKACP